MKTKAIKDLEIGDEVRLVDPEERARITNKGRSRLFNAVGGCFRLDMLVIGGPNKGQKIRNQHHAGEEQVELAE